MVQLQAGFAMKFPPNLDVGEDPFVLSQAYSRLDWEREDQQSAYCPIVVIHVGQKVAFRLHFFGGAI